MTRCISGGVGYQVDNSETEYDRAQKKRRIAAQKARDAKDFEEEMGKEFMIPFSAFHGHLVSPTSISFDAVRLNIYTLLKNNGYGVITDLKKNQYTLADSDALKNPEEITVTSKGITTSATSMRGLYSTGNDPVSSKIGVVITLLADKYQVNVTVNSNASWGFRTFKGPATFSFNVNAIPVFLRNYKAIPVAGGRPRKRKPTKKPSKKKPKKKPSKKKPSKKGGKPKKKPSKRKPKKKPSKKKRTKPKKGGKK